MKALGASEQLQKAGARNGDLIMVGNVDFSYFEESPMAARARLAGYGDARDDEFISGETGGDDEFLTEMEEEAARLARELDEELAELLDADGDVMTF